METELSELESIFPILKIICAGVNFINVFRARFSYKRHFSSLRMYVKKLPKRHSYEKFARLTLMKLTPGSLNN